MGKTLWQRIDHTIASLKLFRNSAAIILHRVCTDVANGTTTVLDERYSIECGAPEKVSTYVNSTLAKEGDMTITIDYVTLHDIFEKSDTGLSWDDHYAILHPGTDEIEFCGVVYAIRDVLAEDWQNNMPGQYVVVLKSATEADE